MDQFTDIDRSNAPYISSKQARAALTELASKNHLSFTHNAGGGEFYNDELGRCQITTYDDVADYEKVRDWLASPRIKDPTSGEYYHVVTVNDREIEVVSKYLNIKYAEPMSIKKQIAELENRGLVDDYDELPITDLKALADSHTRLLEAAREVVEHTEPGSWTGALNILEQRIEEAEKI